MPLPPLPLVDGCLFVDNSGWIEDIQLCYRKLQYHQLHRRINAADNPALSFGSAIHLGLEYRHCIYHNQSPDEFYYKEISDILTKFFEDHPCPEGDFRTLNWSIELLRRYNERYSVEEFNLLEYGQPVICPYCLGKDTSCIWCRGTFARTLMIEMPFALPLFKHGDIQVIYTGKIDLAVSLEDKIFVIDHKTTSMLGQSFFDRMKMSSQQKGYAWAFSQLTGRPVHGYIINAIRTKEPPQYVTNNEVSKHGKAMSPESWWTESLQRERYYLQPHELEEWKQNTISLIEEFFWNYQHDYMPMRTTACTMWGRCPYYEVCALASEDRPLMLNSGLFTDNTWSPLNRL